MELYAKDKYINGDVYNFPDFEDTPTEKKAQPDYSIQITRAAYQKYVRNKTEISIGWATFFDKLRSYGIGRQDVEQYKSFMSGVSSNSSDNTITLNNADAQRKGWGQFMWNDVMSPIPKLKDTILGHFSDIDYDVKADNIDLDSGAEEERRMIEVYAKTHPVFGQMINNLKVMGQIPVEIPEYIPEDLRELEDLKNDGGFKEPYVAELEKLLLHTENISGWDRYLKDQELIDAIDLKYLFAYTDYDEETCKVKWNYADPKYVVMQHDRANGFNNSDYGGLLEDMTISTLKQHKHLIRNSKGEPISDADFKAIAQKYAGWNGNLREQEWGPQSNSTYWRGYENSKVQIFKFWWKDVEVEKSIEYTNKYGKKRIYNYTPEVKSLGNREVIRKTRMRSTYQCWWIVDTDFCIRWGKMPNQPRYEDAKGGSYNEPLLPLVGYKMNTESLVFRAMPVANMYAIAWYRFQNGLAKASQGGYAIDMSRLGDNTGKLDQRKVLKAWRENQVLFYKSGIGGQVGGTPIPITMIPGNLAEVITNELAIMDRCMKLLEDVTGFSGIALGGTPASETPVGTADLSMQQTNKSLMPLMSGIRYIKEELAKRSIDMIQLAIQNDEKAAREYAKVIGEDGVYLVKLAKSMHVRYGINLVSRPDNNMKQEIVNSADLALQSYQAGGEGITFDQRLYILEQVHGGGNLKALRMRMRTMIRKNQARKMQEKQQLIEQQGNKNNELAQIQAQSEQAKQAQVDKSAQQQQANKTHGAITERNNDSDMRIREMLAQKMIDEGKAPIAPVQPTAPPQAPPSQPQVPPVETPMQNPL